MWTAASIVGDNAVLFGSIGSRHLDYGATDASLYQDRAIVLSSTGYCRIFKIDGSGTPYQTGTLIRQGSRAVRVQAGHDGWSVVTESGKVEVFGLDGNLTRTLG